jgi:Family of unknown function (DUF6311)
MMVTLKRQYLFLLPIALGILSFFLVVGPKPLNPNYIGWLFGRLDPTQHYLGWEFFRNSGWQWPLGLNPDYGLGISSSVVYSDSIPLLALLFKPFSTLLTEPFQYFGIWILLCFVLQAYFAFKLIGLINNNIWVKFCGAGLFVFSPPMLWRLNTPAGTHAALVSHFLILIALILVFRNTQKYRSVFWISLMGFATLIHFYLLAIVTILWACDLMDRICCQKSLTARRALIEIAIAFVMIGFIGYQAGYFAIATSSSSDWGYGFFRMNILAPFDPAGWSYALLDIPMPSTWGEGYSYLGLGVIVGLVFFFIGMLGSKVKIVKHARKHVFLLLALVLMTLFAITNQVGISTLNYTIALPDSVIQIANILRSPARLFWSVYYFLILLIVYGITRFFTTSQSIVIVAMLLILQIADSSAGWLSMRKALAVDQTAAFSAPELKDPLWETLAGHYKKILLIPASNKPPFWEAFASFAARHKMATNSVHMARIDSNKQTVSNALLQKELRTGQLPDDAIYIIQNNWVIPAIASLGKESLFTQLDGFNVLAPRCKAYANCRALIVNEVTFSMPGFAPKLNQEIGFSNSARDPFTSYYLASGWSYPESWGTWSDGRTARINLPLPKEGAHSLDLHLNAFVTASHPSQAFRIKVNGSPIADTSLTKASDNHLLIPITSEIVRKPYVDIEFEFLNPARPIANTEKNTDKRELAIGIVSAKFY